MAKPSALNASLFRVPHSLRFFFVAKATGFDSVLFVVISELNYPRGTIRSAVISTGNMSMRNGLPFSRQENISN